MKTDEQEVINFLLTTEIIPLCLRIMESGSELSKTVRLQKRLQIPSHIYIILAYFDFMRVNPRFRKMNVSCRCLNHISVSFSLSGGHVYTAEDSLG